MTPARCPLTLICVLQHTHYYHHHLYHHQHQEINKCSVKMQTYVFQDYPLLCRGARAEFMDEQISISSLLSSPPSLVIFYCSERILQTVEFIKKRHFSWFWRLGSQILRHCHLARDFLLPRSMTKDIMWSESRCTQRDEWSYIILSSGTHS